MASPQRENGYTAIANEIMGVLMRTNFSAYQWRLLIAIWRETYGYQRKDVWLSNKWLVDLTGIQKAHVSRAVSELLDRKVLLKEGNKIAFNKDYEQWIEVQSKSHGKKLPIGVTLVTDRGNKNKDTELPRGVTGDTPIRDRSYPEGSTTKNNNKKRSSTIRFNFQEKKFQNIPLERVKWWEEKFPDVDVVREIQDSMPPWIVANWDSRPKGKKPCKDVKRWEAFIVNWLRIGQEKAAGQRSRAV